MIWVWLIDNNMTSKGLVPRFMTSMECMVSLKSFQTLTLPTVTGRDFLVCHNVALVISFVAEKIPVFLPIWLHFLSPQWPFACFSRICCGIKRICD